MIGIIIGIASVITIMSLGNGFKKSTNEQFNDAGAGKNQASISYMTENMEAPKNNPFKQENISLVEQVDVAKSAKVKEDKDSTYTVKITNTHSSGDASLKKVDKLTDIDEGKGFTNDDNEVLEKVAVIDKKIAKKVFNRHAMGQSIYIDDKSHLMILDRHANLKYRYGNIK